VSPLPIATTVRAARQTLFSWREKGETVVLVPTMGALHKGHLALVAAARKMAKRTVTSIFVNPLQFGPKEDFAGYPRSMENDQKLLAEAGCDLLYAPLASEIYPEGFAVKIDPGPLGDVLEGKFRPGHFAGVATVVAKLLLQTMPDAALFGEKDYQQLLVIQKLARDLDIPVHIIGVPTVRDEDGLALSSRNVYLSPDERRNAAALPRIMQETIAAIRAGAPVDKTLNQGRAQLSEASFAVDYLELADAATLVPIRTFTASPARLLAAARIGTTRLIDNMGI
jgi:pantoate--beta-alanine ligase